MLCAFRNWRAIKLIASNPCADKTLAMAAINSGNIGWKSLEYICRELRADWDVACAAVEQSWKALQFVSDDLRANKELALVALTQKEREYYLNSDDDSDEETPADRDYAEDCFLYNDAGAWRALYFMAKNLRADKVTHYFSLIQIRPCIPSP